MWARSLPQSAMWHLCCRLLQDTIALDVGSANIPVSDYVSALHEDTKKLRVGVPRAHFSDDLDDEVRAAVAQALGMIETWRDSRPRLVRSSEARPASSGN